MRGAAPGAHRPRRGRDRRRQQVPAGPSRDRVDVLEVDNGAVRDVADPAPRDSCARRATPRASRQRSTRSTRSRSPARATCSRSRSRPRARARRSARSRRRSSRSSVATAPRSARSRACTRAAYARRPRVRSAARARSRRSPTREGRRPRILVAKLGQDGHDRGMKVIATAFADLGFDVDIGPLFQTPEEAARAGGRERRARDRRLDARPAATRRSCRSSSQALRAQGAGDIVVVVGRRHPAQGLCEFLSRGRCRAIFGPGTPVPQAAREGARRRSASAQRGDDRSSRRAVAARRRRPRRRPARARARRSRCSRARRADHAQLGRALLEAAAAAHGQRAAASASPARRASARAPSSRRSACTCSTRGHSVAVLAVDPVEPASRAAHPRRQDAHGATRAASPRAFIRPSPSGGTLGGVARRTRETLLLCEAAGFDVVLVETVGVGQSEIAVALDGRLLPRCCCSPARATSCRASRRACSSSPTCWSSTRPTASCVARPSARATAYASRAAPDAPRLAELDAAVLLASAQSGEGIDAVWSSSRSTRARSRRAASSRCAGRARRASGSGACSQEGLLAAFRSHPRVGSLLPELERQVAEQQLSAAGAARALLEAFQKNQG